MLFLTSALVMLLSPLFLIPENVKLLWLFIGILLVNLFCDGHLCLCVCNWDEKINPKQAVD